jgi:DNA-binding helix-hairpin-helix protein with protein kinase domain
MLENDLLRLDLQFFAEDGDGNDGDTPEAPIDNNNDDGNQQPKVKTFTEDEVNEIIKKRLERERKKYADYDDLKAQLEQLRQAEEERKRAEMTELERYKADLEKALNERQTFEQELEKLRESVRQERIKNAFITAATNANIAYIDDAYRLADLSAVTIDEDGNVVGMEDVIKALVEHKPFLLAQAKKEPKPIGESTNAKSDKSDKSAEQLLREAAEKARRTGRPEDLAAYAKLKRELGL